MHVRQPDLTAPTSRWRVAERRRLLAASERLARRRAWWAAQRDAAGARVDELTAELVETAAKVDALEAEPAEAGR